MCALFYWLISLSITSLRFIHVVACLSRIPFLSKDEYYSLCGYITLCLSSGHLGSFYLLAIVSNATVNMNVQFFFFFSKTKTGTSLVIQWLRLQAPNAGGPSSTPDQGTRSHKLQLSVCVQQQKDPACRNWDHAVCQVASVVSDSLWPHGCGPPGSSVCEILRQEYWSRLLCLPSRESSRSRDQTCVSYISCFGRQVRYHQCHLATKTRHSQMNNWKKKKTKI